MTEKPNGNSNNGNSPQKPKSNSALEASGSPGLDPGGPSDNPNSVASQGVPSSAQSGHGGPDDNSVTGTKEQTLATPKGHNMKDSIRNERGQFMPGCSGHPKGRPPKQKPPPRPQSVRELIHQELTETIGIITADGGRDEMQVIAALVRKLRNLALGGCVRSAKLLFDVIEQFELRDVFFQEPKLSPADLAFLEELRKHADEWARPMPGDRDYDETASRADSDSKSVTNDLDDDESIEIIDPGNPRKTH